MATIDVSTLQTFTTAQLLALVEYRIAQVLAGAQAYGTNGRQLTNADLADLFAERDRLKSEVQAEAAATGVGGMIAIVERGERA